MPFNEKTARHYETITIDHFPLYQCIHNLQPNHQYHRPRNTARVQTGFLAQEVERVCKDLNYEFGGLHAPENETDNYSLSYDSFVPLLVKAIQEQQAIIDAQNARIADMESRISTMENNQPDRE